MPIVGYGQDGVDMDVFAPRRVTVLCGAFGSGKTEIAVNMAIGLARKHEMVSLVDIDIVKPMFRSRDIRKAVTAAGVRMVDTIAGLGNADLPIVTGEVDALIKGKAGRVVIDVGGDHLGARALGRYATSFDFDREVLYVINTRRPFASTKDEILRMMGMVEEASRLKVTGLVANTNLGTESDYDLAYEGLEIIGEVSASAGVPIRFAVIYDELYRKDPEQAGKLASQKGLLLFPLKRYLLKPWEN
ncbi:MAG TPA: hypothetical protein PKK63_00535 [Bacillota bacterium]|nr:MAG: hypothetical protein BWY00_01118 [Firmicutes bacterium ADurb.Bin153]HNV34006.1 hypothetical protein [Bacillota bacterium]